MNYQHQSYPPHHMPPPYPPQPVWPVEPRVSPGVLLGVTIWRLAIAASAFIGFGAALSALSKPMPALSQQASLLVGVVYTGLLIYPLFTGGRRHEPRSPWWRGAMTVLMLLVCVTFLAVMGGDLDDTWSLFEHLITPMLVLIDFLAVGRNQAAVKWWHPITWLTFPLAYLIYFVAADLKLYGSFLNPGKSSFPGTVVAFICALLALGYLLYGFGKMKKAAVRAPAANAQPYGWTRPY
jgi:phosphoglycerol transferase MdoB-like AlkP superfamily enzyme